MKNEIVGPHTATQSPHDHGQRRRGRPNITFVDNNIIYAGILI